MTQSSHDLAAGDASGAPVYFDANPLSDPHLTGIGRYAARLALAMRTHRPVRFFAKDREIVPPAGIDWSQDQDLARWARKLWSGPKQPLGTPEPGSIGIWPLLRPIERTFDHEVSILHDLTPLILPHTHKEITRKNFQGLCAKAVSSSDVALAVSHSTAADAEWLMAIDPARLVVAHSGPSLCVARHGHPGKVKRRANVGLVVATLEPRKNPEFLLDWFHATSELPPDAELWWVGSTGWITSRRDLKRFERRPGSTRRVRFLGVVADRSLCRLYRTAGWSIYPSLYEGFGFPVLDALRHGTPVLTSYHSSLREFDVPGLTFFDPCDASTLDQAWRDHRAAVTPDIPIADLDHRYSWDHVARTVIKACDTSMKHEEASRAA